MQKVHGLNHMISSVIFDAGITKDEIELSAAPMIDA